MDQTATENVPSLPKPTTALPSDEDAFVPLESQTNGARLIYSLMRVPPVDCEIYCRLHSSGLYFAKVARSDEKLRYRESDVSAIIRCVVYGYVFDSWPRESLLELINASPEKPTMSPISGKRRKLTLPIACRLVDELFGDGFAQVTRHSLLRVYRTYENEWRYHAYGLRVTGPSVRDYLLLARFVNPTCDRYSSPVVFINCNTTDDRVPFQSSVKIFA